MPNAAFMNLQVSDYAIFGVLSAIETYILWFFFYTFLKPAKQREHHIWIGKAIYFVFQYLTYFFSLPLFSSAVPTFFIAIILSLIFFEDDLLYKTITVYIFIFLFYASRTFALAGFLQFGNHVAGGARFPVLPNHVQAVACILALFSTWLLQFFQSLRHRGRMTLYDLMYAVAPAVFLTSLIILFRLELSGQRSSMSYYWGSAVCLFVVTIILFYHLDKITIINENRLRTRLAMSLLEEDKARFGELISQQEETLRIKHDIRQHLMTLQYLLGEKDLDGARSYLDRVLEQKVLNNHLFTTGNPIVDSLMSRKIPHIKSQGIDIQLNMMIPTHLPVDDMDLCVLLSNLLINAQEACERMQAQDEGRKRSIHLDMSQKKNFLYIYVENSYNGKLIYQNGRYQSTKENTNISGIGLNNIGIIVDKYHGIMEITHDAETFRVRIMLPM
ncbi:MAG: GHKL domain-containing protein [Christensenellales bacterium]|jgi:hypothetical protein